MKMKKSSKKNQGCGKMAWKMKLQTKGADKEGDDDDDDDNEHMIKHCGKTVVFFIYLIQILSLFGALCLNSCNGKAKCQNA